MDYAAKLTGHKHMQTHYEFVYVTTKKMHWLLHCIFLINYKVGFFIANFRLMRLIL